MKRFLVIHTWGIGDWLFFTPVLRALRSAYATCAIEAILGTPATKDIVRIYPEITSTNTFDVRGAPWRIWELAVRKSIRSYDAIIFSAGMHAYRCALTARLFRGKIKVAVTKGGHAPGVRTEEYDPTLHAVENNHKLLRLLDLSPVEGGRPYLPVKAESGVTPGSVLIHPGCDRENPFKRWPLDRFVRVAERLLNSGAKVSVILGPSELEMAPKFSKLEKRPGFSLLINLPLDAALKSIAAHQLLLNSDSGLGHLAAAIGLTTVSIFGPADPIICRPYSDRSVFVVPGTDYAPPCMPCMVFGGRRGCNEIPCLKAISADEVVETVLNALATVKATQASAERH